MRTAVLCAALSGVLVAPAGAQSITLTEAAALARLPADGARVRAVRAAVDVARVDVLAAGRWPNPRLTVDRESAAGVTENMVMVSQLLPITGRRAFEAQAATALVAAASSRADDEIRRLRTDLRLAYADLAAAQIRERELAATGTRLRDLAEVLAKRESAGDAAGFDRLRVEREVLDVDTDRAVAAADRGRAQAILASFFADATEPSTIAASVAARPGTPLPSLDELIAQAEKTRGEFAALRREVEAADFARQAADRRRIPEPEVAAGTKSSSLGSGDIGSVLTLQASIPLFDRGRIERALAAARASQAEARTASLRVVVRGQIAALRTVVLERRGVAERYRTQAVTSADQIERIAQISYDAGERGILELLDAYRIGAAARTRQAALDAAVREAEIELEFVSGWELPS